MATVPLLTIILFRFTGVFVTPSLEFEASLRADGVHLITRALASDMPLMALHLVKDWTLLKQIRHLTHHLAPFGET
ncbi:MAG TPA: hypothetical protein PKH07_18125, partial [bacterium]|nr:hypothetical protein [bacterium]